MPSNKRITDLVDYASILPYDSEMFGIYHPLLGWKSRRMEQRFNKGLEQDKKNILDVLKNLFKEKVEIKYREGCQFEITSIQPGKLLDGKFKIADSIVKEQIAAALPTLENYNDGVWEPLLSSDNIQKIFKQNVIPKYQEYYKEVCKGNYDAESFSVRTRSRVKESAAKASFIGAFEEQLKQESMIAGALQYLLKGKSYNILKNIFYAVTDNRALADTLSKALNAMTPENAYLSLDNLDPQDKDDIAAVALSPISVVHLFRQYFFDKI